eukprot:Rhum_TRINITY_DN17052_c0_g1::Rhum_TRINITY_DN17052_c0_g1_i1::g.165144::m.165144
MMGHKKLLLWVAVAVVAYLRRRQLRCLYNRTRYGKAEWETRVQLAALYRLAAKNHWDEVIYNHITARVPGEETFLVNGFGLRHDEITASNLVKINLDGEIVDKGSRGIEVVNLAGIVIHTAIHAVRHDLQCVLHHHERSGVAVASLKAGFVPTSQDAAVVASALSPVTHKYEGIAVDDAEKASLQKDLGEHKILMLENHGVLVCGETVAEAYVLADLLDRACKQQCQHLTAAGGDPSKLTRITTDVLGDTNRRLTKLTAAQGGATVTDVAFSAAVRALGNTSSYER